MFCCKQSQHHVRAYAPTFLTMATRKSDKLLFMLNESPGPEHLSITGLKLPTYKQVLLSFLANLNHFRTTDPTKNLSLRHEVSVIIINQIKVIYAKSGIPVLGDRSLRRKVLDLHDKFLKVKKNIGRKKNDRDIFLNYLENTAECWPKKVFQIMEASKKCKSEAERAAIDEDIQFLIDQQNDRLQSFGSKDSVTAKLTATRHRRQEEELTRKRQHLDSTRDDFVYDQVEAEEGSGEEFGTDGCEDGAVKRCHKRTSRTGYTITIPHDILKNPDIVAICTRNSISPTAMSAVMHTLVRVCGGDASHISLSTWTAWR